MDRVSQSSVNLRPATGLRHCGNCTMFIPDHACDHVQTGPGVISDNTVCDDWDGTAGIRTWHGFPERPGR